MTNMWTDYYMVRNDKIQLLSKEGWSSKDIATRFELSVARIREILREPDKETRRKRADTMDELCGGTKALVRRRYYDPEFKKRMDEYLAEETHEEFMMRSRANPDYWQKHW